MGDIEKIGYFRTTDRSAENIMRFVKLEDRDLEELPANARVLEIGSGLSQQFARKIKQLRSDTTVVSIDPTVDLGNRKGIHTYTERTAGGELKQVEYVLHGSKYQDPPEVKLQTHKDRVSTAQETGSVIAALAPNLPFAPNSFNLIVDSFGPFMYLSSHSAREYLESIIRILTADGLATIYPINPYDSVLDEIFDVQTRNAKLIEEWKSYLQDVPGISFEFYEIEENHKVEVTNPDIEGGKETERRIGLRIKKVSN